MFLGEGWALIHGEGQSGQNFLRVLLKGIDVNALSAAGERAHTCSSLPPGNS